MSIVRETIEVAPEIRLVPRHPGDAAEVFAVVDEHRAVLREWLGWVDAMRTVYDMRRYAQYAAAQFESRSAFDFTIRVAGAVAGAVGLHALDWSNGSAQIGYWLAPDARGAGVMTRACETLVTHAFDAFGLHRLEIRCALANARSRAVPERLGFRLEGTLAGAHMLHGTFRDTALYAMTAPAWSRQ